MDGKTKLKGRLTAPGAMVPPLLPPHTVPDPIDHMPADWDDRPTWVARVRACAHAHAMLMAAGLGMLQCAS